MGFPRIPFVAGAALGIVATCLFKDGKLREDMMRTTNDRDGVI